MKRAIPILAVPALIACAGGPQTNKTSAQASLEKTPVEAAPCALPDRHRLFIQELLDLWRTAEHEVLALDDVTPPRMYFPSKDCLYALHVDEGVEVGGIETSALGLVPLRALAWEGATLPSGDPVAPGLHSFTVKGEGGPFFVLSLMDLWMEHPKAGQLPNAAEFVIGVGLHELVHTRQVGAVQAELEKRLGARGRALPISDDATQQQMGKDAAYAAVHRESIDAFWAAVTAERAEVREAKLKEGLELVKKRRAMIPADKAWLVEIEPLFLNNEGAAEWTRARTLRALGDGTTPTRKAFAAAEPTFTNWAKLRELDEDALVATIREQTKRKWSQEEGLALVLLLEERMPAWRERVFSEPPGDLHALLAETLEEAVEN